MRLVNTNLAIWSLGISLCCGMVVADNALAQGPDPTIRTFGYLVPNAQASPDFTAESSHSVVTHPFNRGESESTLPQLTDFPSDDHSFDGSSLWISRAAHHATSQQDADSGIYYWLQTEEAPLPPAIGAHTLTGTDGYIISQQVLYLRACTGADEGTRCNYGDSDAGKYLLTATPSGNANAFVVVTAVFSR